MNMIIAGDGYNNIRSRFSLNESPYFIPIQMNGAFLYWPTSSYKPAVWNI